MRKIIWIDNSYIYKTYSIDHIFLKHNPYKNISKIYSYKLSLKFRFYRYYRLSKILLESTSDIATILENH